MSNNEEKQLQSEFQSQFKIRVFHEASVLTKRKSPRMVNVRNKSGIIVKHAEWWDELKCPEVLMNYNVLEVKKSELEKQLEELGTVVRSQLEEKGIIQEQENVLTQKTLYEVRVQSGTFIYLRRKEPKKMVAKTKWGADVELDRWYDIYEMPQLGIKFLGLYIKPTVYKERIASLHGAIIHQLSSKGSVK